MGYVPEEKVDREIVFLNRMKNTLIQRKVSKLFQQMGSPALAGASRNFRLMKGCKAQPVFFVGGRM
jgi:hypothetical protein